MKAIRGGTSGYGSTSTRQLQALQPWARQEVSTSGMQLAGTHPAIGAVEDGLRTMDIAHLCQLAGHQHQQLVPTQAHEAISPPALSAILVQESLTDHRRADACGGLDALRQGADHGVGV